MFGSLWESERNIMSYSVKQAAPVVGTASTPRYRARRFGSSVFETLGLLLTLFFILTPIAWMALTAFKQEGDVYTLKVFFTPTLQNFVTIFQPPLSFGPLLVNSVIVATTTILISTPLALMAAYAFSRYHFVGNTALLIWILTTQFLPQVVITIPFFNLLHTIRLVNTYTLLVILILAVTLPYAISIIKGFVDSMPVELEEASLVDG